MALPESAAKRLSSTNLDKLSERELRTLLAALVDGIQAVCTKLDADAGVTDVNYATTFAGYVID